MPIKRNTAKKVRILDLVNGEWVKKEGRAGFILTHSNEDVFRAKVLATVVGKFVSADGNFASITLDDFTACMRAKVWKDLKPLQNVEIGDLVNVIGKVREYDGEIYLVPEIVNKLDDPNFELLRKLEILLKIRELKAGKKLPAQDLRKEVLTLIEQNKNGIKYEELLEKLKAKEEEVESIVNELLGEGICYEPAPGKIKKI